MRRLDITGERYGKLVAIERLPEFGTASRWRLKCECGKETTALLGNLRKGDIKSCGCAGSRTTIGIRTTKHGHGVGYKKSRTASAWRNAKTRCFNKGHVKYPSYGGRGITMCKEWADDFRIFLRDMGECPEGLTLERKDVNGNYEPGNCEWIPQPDQAKNRRNTIRVQTNSGSVSLREFAESIGVSYKGIYQRMKARGETAQDAADWFKTRNFRRNNKPNHQNSEKR